MVKTVERHIDQCAGETARVKPGRIMKQFATVRYGTHLLIQNSLAACPNYYHRKGRHQRIFFLFFWALPEPPSTPPNSGNLVAFFQTTKKHFFALMTK